MKHIGFFMGLAMAASVVPGMIFGFGGTVSAAGEVKINKKNFPDGNFRSYIAENFDEDGNGSLSFDECIKVDWINVSRTITQYDDKGNPVSFDGKLIKSVKGIEFFPNLLILECAVNEITDIDVSGNPNLETLTCCINKISELDLSKNEYLKYLDCKTNKLTKLDLSHNPKLKSIDIGYNQLKKIDLSKNLRLESIYCNKIGLSSLDLSHNKKLQYLSCEDNNLTKIDLSKNPKLKYVNFNRNALKNLDLSANKKIEDISVNGSKIKSLTLKEKRNLSAVRANSTELTSVDISQCPKLFLLELSLNKSLTKLQVTECPKLQKLDLRRCKVKEINVQGCTSLSGINASATYLKDLDVTLLPGKSMALSIGIEDNEDRDDGYGQVSGMYCAKAEDPSVATLGIVDNRTAIIGKTLGVTTMVITYCDMNNIDQLPGDIRQALDSYDPEPFAKAYPQYTHRVNVNITVAYKDVVNSKDFWFTPTYALSKKGVVKGYDNQTRFKPANDCTRAQMVTFLWRLAGTPAPKSDTCKFSDVKKSDYYYKAVIWAVEQGITTGVSKDKFAPSGVCTRAQTVTFLWRMAGKPEVGSAKNPFSDVKSGDYFYKAVIWASGKKIVAGYKDGTFKPSEKCLRRQMVTFLYKYDKTVKK